MPVSELLGLTALEAMASGTPVVASRIGGLAEVVVDGETGFLVEPGDLGGAVYDFKRRLIEATLHQVRGNRTHAANRLGISVRTVTVHVSNLLRKTGAPSRTAVALWAVQRDIGAGAPT